MSTGLPSSSKESQGKERHLWQVLKAIFFLDGLSPWELWGGQGPVEQPWIQRIQLLFPKNVLHQAHPPELHRTVGPLCVPRSGLDTSAGTQRCPPLRLIMTARKLPWVSLLYLLAVASYALFIAFQLSVRSLKINFSWSFLDTELLFLEALQSKSNPIRSLVNRILLTYGSFTVCFTSLFRLYIILKNCTLCLSRWILH